MYTLNEENAKKLELPGRTCSVLVGNETLNAENLTFGVTEVPANTKMTAHRHEQEEVIYIMKGHGQVKVDDSVEKLKEGTVIYLPSNAEHYIDNRSEDTMKFAFAFSPTLRSVPSQSLPMLS